MLRQQVARLTPLEHLLLTWLAVLREWTPLDTLLSLLVPRPTRAQVLEALEALSRRSLVERGAAGSFSLQSVVMEYLTDALLEQLAEEIRTMALDHCAGMPSSRRKPKTMCERVQVRLLVRPLLERLRAELGADAQRRGAASAPAHAHSARKIGHSQGYGPANVITLLKELRGHLRGLDLSRLAIRGAYLQGVEMQDTTLAGALMRECVFTETFDAITAVVISQQRAVLGGRQQARRSAGVARGRQAPTPGLAGPYRHDVGPRLQPG